MFSLLKCSLFHESRQGEDKCPWSTATPCTPAGSREKLEQNLKDASPLPLVLLDRQGVAAGRATVGLEATGTEGYFPVWSDKQDREVANLRRRSRRREGVMSH